jgi:hypothetical protein
MASLADFELCVNDSLWKQSISYVPKIGLLVPCNQGFAFTFYGGLAVNLYDRKHMDALTTYNKQPRTYAIGGVSMRFNHAGRFPVDIFAEYKWPTKGVDKSALGQREQLFRVGILFSPGIDH